jgi:hypothetical protein
MEMSARGHADWIFILYTFSAAVAVEVPNDSTVIKTTTSMTDLNRKYFFTFKPSFFVEFY